MVTEQGTSAYSVQNIVTFRDIEPELPMLNCDHCWCISLISNRSLTADRVNRRFIEVKSDKISDVVGKCWLLIYVTETQSFEVRWMACFCFVFLMKVVPLFPDDNIDTNMHLYKIETFFSPRGPQSYQTA